MTTPSGTDKALTIGAFGARGTGKTAWVLQQLAAAKPARLLVWDFKSDPAMMDAGRAIDTMPDFIQAMRSKAFKLRYIVDHSRPLDEQFSLFCRAAWAAGNLTMFVDELPEVTKANRAPPAWRQCVNVGRDYVFDGERKALTIIGAGQRAAECDKSFMNNLDVLHTGRLTAAGDARYVADLLGCDFRELSKLPDLHYIERRAGQVEPVRGVLTFKKKSSRAAKP